MDQNWLQQIDDAILKGDAHREVDLLHAAHNTFLEEDLQNGSFAQSEVLGGFVQYALARRFGWSESAPGREAGSPNGPQNPSQLLVRTDSEETENTDPLSPTSRLRRQRRSSIESTYPITDQARENLKHAINQSLDAYLSALRNSPAVRSQLVTVLKHWLTSPEGVAPFVRGQVFKFFYDWLKAQTGDAGNECSSSSSDGAGNAWVAECFDDIHQLVELGLTDVWSAIRKSCANRLSSVADAFLIDQVQRITEALLRICADSESSWQKVEGSLLGLSSIVKRFRVELLPMPQELPSIPEELAVFTIHFGRRTFRKLPDFISDTLHTVLFNLLAHPQLSVRESANKVFAAFLARSDESTAVATLDEAVARLNEHRDTPDRLASADEAAGLMTLCITILKQLPADIFEHRPEMTSIFHAYLAHSASTVRQVTSTLFECLATRDPSSKVDMLGKVLSTLTGDEFEKEQLTWQAKEGRLLAIELIVRRLVRGHLTHLLNLELRLELKSPEVVGDGMIDASPLPLWPKAIRTKSGQKSASEDMSLIDRLRTGATSMGAQLWTQLICNTVECMMSSRWELRRMADQVLPLLTQVVFWFDVSILEGLWTDVLQHEHCSTLGLNDRTLAACVTLKYSLCLSVRLTQLLQTASVARLLVTDRAEQVQALLNRFSEVASPLAPSVHLVLRQVASSGIAGINNRLLREGLEVLLYANSYQGTAQREELTQNFGEVISALESVYSSAVRHDMGASNSTEAAPGESCLLTMSPKQAVTLQSSIVSSMYSVFPELALKISPGHLLKYARLQLGWALQYDHMEERKCTLEATRRVLLRVVRLRNLSSDWPWDVSGGESLGASSPCVTLSPAAVACSPCADNPQTPQRPGLYVSVEKTTGIRQAILASIDSLINVGMPPKQSLHRLSAWPSRSHDQQWLGLQGVDPKPVATSILRALIPLVEQKGLEMSVLRLVMEVLCAACILLRDLDRCLPSIAASMVLRLRREGVTSRVEQQKLEECSNLGMHSNETKVDTAESSDEGGADGGHTTSDWDDDSWDDESGILSIDTLVCEFGKFLMALRSHFPGINATPWDASSVSGGIVTPGKKPTSSVIEYLATSTTSPCCWPGLSDENARILNWVVVTASAQPQVV